MNTVAAALPKHAPQFHPNVAFGITSRGCASLVSVYNYYNTTSLAGAAQEDGAAIAEVSFYDCEGRCCFLHRERLEPFGSLHLDLREKLIESHCEPEAYGAVLCRLIPEVLPPSFRERVLSTEYIVEITSAGGAKSFVHNVGSVAYVPNLEEITSEQVFADAHTSSRYLTLINNYHGLRFPLLSRGQAHAVVTNHRGAAIGAWSDPVPPRGTRLFSFEERFPSLKEFLDGQAGSFHLESYNLIRKPLTWVVSPNDEAVISINHM